MTHNITKPIILLLTVMLLGSAEIVNAQKKIPAFPGAEGFGEYSLGGRGGKVIYVTNLNDNGPGSFRSAIDKKGPRIVLFKVSGLIELKSSLKIREPYLTIAGQTAPGDGICIKNYNLEIRNTHDIIIRYIRSRPGDVMRIEQDAISIYASQNVIIDHCSTSWGTDETLSVTKPGTNNITVQWCFITESLNNSVHHKGLHGYGSLLRFDGNVSFHHNLYADHYSRNPRPGCYGNMKRGGFLDFRNNLIYNWGLKPGYTHLDKAAINYIGNYLKPGPSTNKDVSKVAFEIGSSSTNIYVSQNFMEGFPEGSKDNWKLLKYHDNDTSLVYAARLPVPLVAAYVKTESAQATFNDILINGGAVLPQRDAVDERVVEQVKNNTGKIIDTQSQVGGWPSYKSSKAPLDSDNDGMPDAWEKKYNLNPRDPSDADKDPDGDGYTNIEEYLNGSNPLVKDTAKAAD